MNAARSAAVSASASEAAQGPTPVRGPARAPGRRPAAPPALHVVPAAPWRAPLGPFLLVSVAVVVAGLLGLLLLNTLVAQDSFRVHRLEKDGSALREREETLKTEVAKAKAPGILALRAIGLGLVPGNTPGFVRLRDGRVMGEPKTALAPPAATTAPVRPKPASVTAVTAATGAAQATAVTKPGSAKLTPAKPIPAKLTPATTSTATKVAVRKPAHRLPPTANAPKRGRTRRG